MAKRKFKLPGVNDLSKEQHTARGLPLNGKHLIIGGPGTGKSVLALLRSRRYHENKRKYVFLVYNHLLNNASKQLFGGELISQQWQSWFMALFSLVTNEAVPRLPAEPGKEWTEIDWDGVDSVIGQLEQPPDLDFRSLVIDEGQDMPPQFYSSLTFLGFKDIYVVADQNQQIGKNNSTIGEIQDVLNIDFQDVIELKQNYRNTFPIARLAREFFIEDHASPPPELPPQEISAFCPMLYEYKSDQFEVVIEKILKEADKDPRRLIGIITPNNAVRKRYFDKLKAVNVPLDNKKARITTYQSGGNSGLSFEEGGIMVINAKACKGLEFDIVILADINEHLYWPKIKDEKRRLFYVMIARAMSDIIMLRESGKPCPIEAILPNTPDVLEKIYGNN